MATSCPSSLLRPAHAARAVLVLAVAAASLSAVAQDRVRAELRQARPVAQEPSAEEQRRDEESAALLRQRLESRAISRVTLVEPAPLAAERDLRPEVATALSPGLRLPQPRPEPDPVATTPGRDAVVEPLPSPVSPVPAEPRPGSLPPPVPVPAPEGGAAGPVQHPPILKGELYARRLDSDEEAVVERLLMQQLAAESSVAPLAMFPDLLTQRDTDDQVVDLKAHVLLGAPLEEDRVTGEFVGTIAVGVSNPLAAPGAPANRLSVPMTFQVFGEAQVSPAQLSVAETGPPYARFEVRTPSPGNGVRLRVTAPSAPEGMEFTLPVRPSLQLRTDRRTLQGYGLETTRLYVWVRGSSERGAVVLSADPSAHFDQSVLPLGEDGYATTLLRSDAPGPVTIRAEHAGLGATQIEVEFRPPWTTLAFALAGGIVGGTLRLSRRRQDGRHQLVALGLAMLTGVLVFALAAVGVNVLPLVIPVQVGYLFVGVVSAMGAWFGTRLLEARQDAGGDADAEAAG